MDSILRLVHSGGLNLFSVPNHRSPTRNVSRVRIPSAPHGVVAKWIRHQFRELTQSRGFGPRARNTLHRNSCGLPRDLAFAPARGWANFRWPNL